MDMSAHELVVAAPRPFLDKGFDVESSAELSRLRDHLGADVATAPYEASAVQAHDFAPIREGPFRSS